MNFVYFIVFHVKFYIRIHTLFLRIFHENLMDWHFQRGTFKVALSKRHFQSGTFKVALSKWHFQSGTFKVAFSKRHFQSGTFKEALSKWHCAVINLNRWLNIIVRRWNFGNRLYLEPSSNFFCFHRNRRYLNFKRGRLPHFKPLK